MHAVPHFMPGCAGAAAQLSSMLCLLKQSRAGGKEDMRISPRYTSDDWKRLSFETEADWDTAIDILTDRIEGRFLRPVAMIERYEFAGFATMAIDCLLIETLQQFVEGMPKTPGWEGEKYFVKYLTVYFGGDFTDDVPRCSIGRLDVEFYTRRRRN